MSHYATVAINIYLASNLKMIHKKAHKVCKILRPQFRLQYARWYGLYKNAMCLMVNHCRYWPTKTATKRFLHYQDLVFIVCVIKCLGAITG